jgi:hypothetical protein
MTDPDNKLTVRVKLAPKPLEANPLEARSQRPHYSYRWDRILLACAALLVVAALALRWLIAPHAPERGGETATAQEATDTGERTPAEYQPAPQITGPVATNPQPAIPAEFTQPKEPAVLPDAAGTAHLAGEKADTVVDQEGTATAEPARDAALTPGEARILSKQVKRFLLTDSVRNREPVGSLSEVVPNRAESGVMAVYAFSEVVGMAGKTLHYRWIYNGKIRAEVRVGVGSDRWRSHSSKIVTANMRGPWRVELTSGPKELLATAEFEY